MPRARTKQQLLDFGDAEYRRLLEILTSFSPEQQSELIVFENRTIKDIIAHLHDWHALVFAWENEGKNNQKPVMPAKGYTWKDLPTFNEMLYQKSKNKSWEDVLTEFQSSHKKAMEHISHYSPDDLETKAKFTWTGTTNIASYYASCTSSHYVWAIDLLKKIKKA